MAQQKQKPRAAQADCSGSWWLIMVVSSVFGADQLLNRHQFGSKAETLSWTSVMAGEHLPDWYIAVQKQITLAGHC